jgi:hypothetical protein
MKRIREFDYCVINAQERQEETVDKIEAIILAEHQRVGRHPIEL